MQDYRKLRVWQNAHKLALETYAAAAYLKSPASWALRNQMHRAAISVPANIAEGCGRSSDADLRRFLFHSLGSLNELEYHFLLASDLGYLTGALPTKAAARVGDVRRMLTGLIKCVENRQSYSEEA